MLDKRQHLSESICILVSDEKYLKKNKGAVALLLQEYINKVVD